MFTESIARRDSGVDPDAWISKLLDRADRMRRILRSRD